LASRNGVTSDGSAPRPGSLPEILHSALTRLRRNHADVDAIAVAPAVTVTSEGEPGAPPSHRRPHCAMVSSCCGPRHRPSTDQLSKRLKQEETGEVHRSNSAIPVRMPRDGVRFASLLPILLLPESSRARVAVSAPKSMSLPTIVREHLSSETLRRHWKFELASRATYNASSSNALFLIFFQRSPRIHSRPAFQRTLLRWYDQNRRDLPWRRTRRPLSHLVIRDYAATNRVAAVPSTHRLFLERSLTS
jgi:hypothetical protein